MGSLVRFARSTFSSLRTRNFRLYFFGQGVSLIGAWVQSVAQSWMVLHLTGSGVALGAVAALQCAPTLFLGPFAGVVADRLPKRRLLMATQSVLALVALALGVLVAANAMRVWMVYAAAAVLGLVNAIDYPTRQAFLFELAGPNRIQSAVGLNGTMVNVTRVVGPALAGTLIAVTGMASCFMLNAASFLVVIACLALMRPAELHRRPAAHEPKGGVAEGLAYTARTPVVRESIVMMALIGVLVYEFNVTLPMIAKFAFAGDASALAYLMSSMGAGAIVGGLVTAGRRGDGLGRLSLAALGFGGFTALAGAAPSLHAAALAMAFAGLFSARFTGLSNGLLQLKSSPGMRSRTVALWSSAFIGSTFIGAPLLGWVGQQFGPRTPMIVGGVVGGIASAILGLLGRKAALAAHVTKLPDAAVADERVA